MFCILVNLSIAVGACPIFLLLSLTPNGFLTVACQCV